MGIQSNIYIICSVRSSTPSEIYDYVSKLEEKGHSIHFPPRDVNQNDETGVDICNSHLNAMIKCDEVHIFWDKDSYGSHFDLGMAFALNKKIKLIKTYHSDNNGKSYLKVIKYLENNV